MSYGEDMDLSGFNVVATSKAVRPRKEAWLPNGEAPTDDWDERTVQGEVNAMWGENAFTIISRVKRLMKQAWKAQGLDNSAVDAKAKAYEDEARSGDYNHVLQVSHAILTDEAYLDLDPLPCEDDVSLERSTYKSPPQGNGCIEDFYGKNAVSIIVLVSNALMKLENFKDPFGNGPANGAALVKKYREEAESGDYEHLVRISRYYLYHHCGILSSPLDPDAQMCKDCGGTIDNNVQSYCINCLD